MRSWIDDRITTDHYTLGTIDQNSTSLVGGSISTVVNHRVPSDRSGGVLKRGAVDRRWCWTDQLDASLLRPVGDSGVDKVARDHNVQWSDEINRTVRCRHQSDTNLTVADAITSD